MRALIKAKKRYAARSNHYKKELLRNEQQFQQLTEMSKTYNPKPPTDNTSNRISSKFIAIEKYYQEKLEEAGTVYTSFN